MTPKSPSANLASKLLELYKEEFKVSKSPDWAFPSEDWDYTKTPIKNPFPPSIPFIGRNYSKAPKKIALYASAENLAHYERDQDSIPDSFRNDQAWVRHQEAFNNRKPDFYPNVHIGPVNDGSLLCATLFICQSMNRDFPEDPTMLLEMLAVANVGKFSIAGKKNKDYAGKNKIEPSLPYFQIDLEILQPDILILPETMYKKNKRVRTLISEALPKATIIPVYQFNHQVVHGRHLKKFRDRGTQLESQLKLREDTLVKWTGELSGYKKGSPYWYYARLELMLSKMDGIKK